MKVRPTINLEDRLDLSKNIPLKVPLIIYVEPSGFCNLSCSFCPQSTGALKKDMMPVNLFYKLIDDIVRFDVSWPAVKTMRICGNGEPLTNKNIIDMLDYANGEVGRIELVTNGWLLNEDLIKNLPELCDKIIISIAEKPITDGYMANIRKLFQTKEDYESKCVIHIKHNGMDNLAKEYLSQYCDEMFEENIVPLWPGMSIIASGKFRWGGEPTVKRVCPQIFKGLQVWANGDIVPCCVDWQRKNVLGNVWNDSIKDIWHGKELKTLQVNHLTGKKPELEPCKECQMNDFCEVDNLDKLMVS